MMLHKSQHKTIQGEVTKEFLRKLKFLENDETEFTAFSVSCQDYLCALMQVRVDRLKIVLWLQSNAFNVCHAVTF